jgi:hypothetical protein
LNSNANKKIRTTFTDEQKRSLDIYFQKNPYPDPSETQELSEQLVLPENVIKVWFQNKRSRDKQRKFSHSNRMLNKLAIMKNNTSSSSNNSSLTSNVSIPVPSATSNMAYNLHLLQSKFGGYAALNAVVNAVQQQQQQQQQQNNHYYNGFNF